MKYMLKKLRAEDISNITLFADPHVVDFYRGIGFRSDPEGIKVCFGIPTKLPLQKPEHNFPSGALLCYGSECV
jgi:hypothetical protein